MQTLVLDLASVAETEQPSMLSKDNVSPKSIAPTEPETFSPDIVTSASRTMEFIVEFIIVIAAIKNSINKSHIVK
jgi:hypothetical protein